MGAALRHRGPDDEGLWLDPAHGVALAFRRLAIMDLSPAGHQPMASASGRFTLVFNGEVFNHGALRTELAASGAAFRGHSDTEVILAAFERWGVAAAVRRFVGMFAIAVWDAERRELTLLRDRLGIKPLYLGRTPDALLFGSELKALMADPGLSRAVDPEAMAAYLRYLYVPAPASILRDVRKLPPGHLVTVRPGDAAWPASEAYWSVEAVAARGLAEPFRGTPDEAVDALADRLHDAVRLRLEADVPLGALLSGGIDSSTVVALMQRLSPSKVRTFTIGFDQREHDEADHARAVAAHLGTEHTELRLTGADALAVVPQLPEMFDEPLADPSQIPTYLVCALARRHVTVALTGDGGDELFAGYHRYREGQQAIARALGLPGPVRQLAGAALGGLSPALVDSASRIGGPLTRGLRLPGLRAAKLGALLRAGGDAAAMYRSLLSAGVDPARLGVAEGGTDDVLRVLRGGGGTLLDRMQLADQLRYLPDDLLAKVDRASMAVSLEARVPLLDHRVVEFAWTLPPEYRLRAGVTKWPLRQLLYRHVPRELVERPKVGFTAPVGAWLEGPLRPWAADHLATAARRWPAAGGLWSDFLGGRVELANAMWTLASLAAWAGRWGVELPAATDFPARGSDR